MSRKQIKKLSKAIKKELDKFTETSKKTLQSSIKLQGASRSFAGDQEQAKQSSILNAEHKQNLQNLYQEIIHQQQLPPPKKITPICYIEIETEHRQKMSLFLINHAIHIPKYTLITKKSAIGAQLLNKTLNQTITYQTDHHPVTAQITAIE